MIAYLIALWISIVATSLTSQSYMATCQVRIWPPPTNGAEPPSLLSPNAADALIKDECRNATSDQVLENVLKLLEIEPEFTKLHGENWRQESTSAKLRWLRKHVEVVPVGSAYIVNFVATAANPGEAAKLANATANGYCEFRNTPSAAPAGAGSHLNVEILNPAVPAIRPEDDSNPIAEGLLAGLGNIGLLAVGASIGFLGFLARKAGRADSADHT